jgi:anti-sigma regulatory factor (Ser/Thr protein kinase)
MEWTRTVVPERGLRHEALLYGGQGDFVESCVPFILEALRTDEPVLALLEDQKISWLRDALGDDALDVFFEDMGEVGGNPARLITAVSRFVAAHPESPALRVIGEPVHAGRSAAALDECRRHEALVNIAFHEGRELWMLCLYDTDALPADVVEGALATHPLIAEGGSQRPSDTYERAAGALAGELSPPPADAEVLAFGAGDGRRVRGFAEQMARSADLRPQGVENVVFAAGELTANSVRHAGGGGTLLAWLDEGTVVLEVRDRGTIDNPLVGRLRPHLDEVRGRGLWLVNQLCDLVQIRSGADGTAIRVHVS